MLLEIALGPMLWILFGTSAVATVVAILAAVFKRGWPFALLGAALPLFVAGAGAGLARLDLHYAVQDEGSGMSVVAPSLGRALMLAMLGFAGTLAPAIPAIMGAPKDVRSPWAWAPLSLIPVMVIVQVPFGYPATALIRLVPYLGIAGALAKRGASPAILLPVVAAGELAATAVAHVDLFSSMMIAALPGVDMIAGSAREIAAGRWFGAAAFGAVVMGQAIARKWTSLLLLAPPCLASAWIGDATDQIVMLFP